MSAYADSGGRMAAFPATGADFRSAANAAARLPVSITQIGAVAQ
jgi:hypothetical protein